MVLIVSILHKADGLGYLGKPQYSNVWVNLTQACYLQMGIDTCLLSQAQTAEDTLDISFDPRGFVAEQNLWFPLLEFQDPIPYRKIIGRLGEIDLYLEIN